MSTTQHEAHRVSTTQHEAHTVCVCVCVCVPECVQIHLSLSQNFIITVTDIWPCLTSTTPRDTTLINVLILLIF